MSAIAQLLRHQLCPPPLGILGHFAEAFHLILVQYRECTRWAQILLAVVLVLASTHLTITRPIPAERTDTIHPWVDDAHPSDPQSARPACNEEALPTGSDELTVNAGCIICFSELVDTVFMPCRHMIACAVEFPIPLTRMLQGTDGCW
ncbi:hypothetical protein Q9L58_006102 [Maublancomyces gigas]|uniref:RING-type domain-containing protein n=1 Tax=Discina gigas TaxID=1032678 RepID=A0ABR3GGC6_9PEZI